MPEPAPAPPEELPRRLRLFDAVWLVVASVIGSGIFLTPGRVAELVPHVALIFLAWGAGGLLSLAGALANAEMGAMFPRAGGDYVYLREAFHPLAGFLVGWLGFTVIFTGTIATLAAGAAEGIAHFAPLPETGQLAVAIALVVAFTLLNARSVRLGAELNNLAAMAKVAALVAFAVLGPVVGAGSLRHFCPGEGAAGGGLAAFGLALSPVLFSYLGWNATVYVAGEIREPGRNLPRSLFLGLGICTGIYLVVNAVYLYALPLAELRGAVNVGEAAARALFGPGAGDLVAGFVLLSILGTLHATVLVGPRIAYAMARDGLFFRVAERVHPAWRTPGAALFVQCGVAVGLLLVLRSFPSALDYTTFAIVLATLADVAALYRLRRSRPELPRPYRAWGYPVVPGLYLVANGAIAWAMAAGRPFECAVGLAMLVAGVPFYFAFRRAGRLAAGQFPQ